MIAFLIILTIIVFFSFFYKIYLQVKIKNPNATFFSAIFRLYYLTDLLPLKWHSDDHREKILRKKANYALVIFYLAFIAIQILSITA